MAEGEDLAGIEARACELYSRVLDQLERELDVMIAESDGSHVAVLVQVLRGSDLLLKHAEKFRRAGGEGLKVPGTLADLVEWVEARELQDLAGPET